MFFNFTDRKIINISLLVLALFISTVVSLYINGRYKTGEAFKLYTRSLNEDINYWWSNKIFGAGTTQYSSLALGTEALSIPVLVYHGLPDEGGGDNPFSSTQFAEHMRALRERGWQTITLDQFEQFVRGNIKLPEKSFLLTFDDGRKDTFYPSDPVLKDLGMNAVMYAITKKSIFPTKEQSTYYLSPYELKAMERSPNWEVESHGRDSHDWYYIDDKGAIGHFFSNRLWLENENRLETEQEFRERIAYDLSNSKKDLDTELEKNVTSIAFPFSDFGQDGINYKEAVGVVAEEVRKVYKFAFYQVWSDSGETFNYPNADEVMMKRIEPLSNWNSDYLVETLESGIAKKLPYEKNSFGREWVSSWGDISYGENISMIAGKDTAGGAVALNGSWLWRDYTFRAEVNWMSGSNMVLIARRQDDDNYFGCNFGRGRVYIKSVVNNSSYNVIDGTYIPPEYGKNVNLGINVDGTGIRCLVNNQVVIESQSINTRIPNGGIGLEVWDVKNGVAKATVDNIRVTVD